MPFRIGPLELAIILLIVVVVFGTGRLAEVGGALGKSIRDFKKGLQADDDEKKEEAKNKAAAEKPAEKTTE